MSADLFAAFGACEAAPESKIDLHQTNSSSNLQSDLLLPDFEPLSISQDCPAQKCSFGSKPSEERLWRQDQRGTDVLFDASEDEPQVEDDFGDFEEVEASIGNDDPVAGDTSAAFPSFPSQHATTAHIGTSRPVHDLLGLDEEETSTTSHSEISHSQTLPTVTSAVETTNSAAEDNADWGDFSDPVISHSPAKDKAVLSPPQRPLQPSVGQRDTAEDEWEPFGDDDTPEVQTGPRKLIKAKSAPKDEPLQTQLPIQQTASTGDIRPSNIPPPALLLQLLPQVFTQLRETTTFQSVPTVTAITQAYTVSAYLIAGRTLRWKRDAHLSQSMRIGPSSSSGGRGMKLTSLSSSKTENLKEDAGAADTVSAWSENAHFFNSSVSKAGLSRPLMTLSMDMKQRVESELGVWKAGHACALCGIRRDERVPGVDMGVEDSFGEFWVEFWGHRDCRDFWGDYRGLLSQR